MLGKKKQNKLQGSYTECIWNTQLVGHKVITVMWLASSILASGKWYRWREIDTPYDIHINTLIISCTNNIYINGIYMLIIDGVSTYIALIRVICSVSQSQERLIKLWSLLGCVCRCVWDVKTGISASTVCVCVGHITSMIHLWSLQLIKFCFNVQKIFGQLFIFTLKFSKLTFNRNLQQQRPSKRHRRQCRIHTA